MLFKVSQELEDIIKKEEIELVRKRLVENNTYKKEIDKNKSQNAIIFSTKHEFVKLLTVLQYWRILGREALFLKEKISHIGADFKKSQCAKCKSQESLSVMKVISLYELITKFRIFLAGRMFNDKTWTTFYKQNQKFETICNNCKMIEDVKKFLRANKQLKDSNSKLSKKRFNSLNTKMGEGEKLYKEIFREQMEKSTKSILLKWLMLSKSRILHNQNNGVYGQSQRFQSLENFDKKKKNLGPQGLPVEMTSSFESYDSE